MWRILNKIFKLVHNKVNTYLIISQSEGCLIDASIPANTLIEELDKLGESLKLRYILLTHGHFNHIRYIPQIKFKLGGRIFIHPEDLSLLHELPLDLEEIYPLKNLNKLEMGSLEVIAYHTPGHTGGSMCFYVKDMNALFSGDTLLKGGFGEIKGPYAMDRMIRSLKTVSKSLPPETIVYPGHGSETILKCEAWLDGLDLLS